MEASEASESAGGSAPPVPAPPSRSPWEVAADLNLELARLGWPVHAKLVVDREGHDELVVRPFDTDRPAALGPATLHVGPGSLGRPGLIEALLAEIRSLGWDKLAPTTGRPHDVLWCAPQ